MVLGGVLTHADHHVTAIITPGGRRMLDLVRKFKPDIAAFSVTTGAHRWAAQAAQSIKQEFPNILTIAGGAHPTFYPDFARAPGLDCICRGEGEGAILDFAHAADAGADWRSIPNLAYAAPDGKLIVNPLRAPVPDLDALPHPARCMYYRRYPFLRDNPTKMIITGRGCPDNCSFCFNHAIGELYAPCGGYPVRRLSPERCIDMINWSCRDYRIKYVRFDDDVFILDKKWLFEFLEIYARRVAVPFSCLVRANLMTDEIADALANAGCAWAHFGVESGNEHLRNQVLDKKIADEQIVRTAEILKKYNIRIGTFNMLNLPGETLDNGWETVRLNRRIGAHEPWCSLVQPYPGTRLEQRARAQNLLPEGFSADTIPTSYFRNSPISNPDRAALENLHKVFYLAVKAPGLHPLLRRMVQGRPSALLDAIFKVTYGIRYARVYNNSLWRVWKTGRLNARQF
jgi:radical SAM superfamily enzyme YgiQ (UPF0313 family)